MRIFKKQFFITVFMMSSFTSMLSAASHDPYFWIPSTSSSSRSENTDSNLDDFVSVLNSVDPEYQAVFELEANLLFEEHLKKLKRIFASRNLRSIFFIQPNRLTYEEEQLLVKIDSFLKLAGVPSLIQCVDCRPGGRWTIHQFADQVYQHEKDSIIDANFAVGEVTYTYHWGGSIAIPHQNGKFKIQVLILKIFQMLSALYPDLDIEIQSLKKSLLESLKKASEKDNLIQLEKKRKAKQEEDEEAIFSVFMKGIKRF